MITVNRCDSSNEEFIDLVRCLDKDLTEINGERQNYYNQYNVLPLIQTVVVIKKDELPIGCGCFKEYDSNSIEIKRMYINPQNRGKGYSKMILEELEKWAFELGYTRTLLETGHNQVEALGLYNRFGYHQISNYGQYVNVKNSVCFEKAINYRNR